MKRKLKSIIAVALCAVGLSAFAAEPVKYLDWNAAHKKLVEKDTTDYEVYSGQTTLAVGTTYVVQEDKTVDRRIKVNGTPSNPTRLILCDGVKLEVQRGVEVVAQAENGVMVTNALIICAQSVGDSAGALEAKGDFGDAGIGGGNGGAGGIVTINGGKVTATGKEGAAGIGGGNCGAGGSVTINGGTVMATTSFGSGGAGIGGGNGGEPGTVNFGKGLNFYIEAGGPAEHDPISQEDYQKDHSASWVQIEFVPPVISAVSAEGFLDLTVGDRVAKAEETLVVDPAWGEAETATVAIEGESGPRTYMCASNDLWRTAKLETGRYAMTLTAGAIGGDDAYAAAFWKTGDDWVVFDSSNITADVTFEAGKTYLVLGTNTVNGNMLTVTDGAKFVYDESAPAGFFSGVVAVLPKRYGKTVGGLFQIVEKIKGCEDNPWVAGGDADVVEAWTNGTDTLVIGGKGTVKDLSEIPDAVKGGIAAITVTEATVKGAEADAFKDFKDITVTLPENWQGELPKDGAWYGATGVELSAIPFAIKNMKMQQRYPWNGLVDVSCDVTGEGYAALDVKVFKDGSMYIEHPTVEGEKIVDLNAAGGVSNDVHFVWNAAKDLSPNVMVEKIKMQIKAICASAIAAIPEAVPGLTYNGNERTGVAEGTGYTLEGNTATNAGDYTATATLANGYYWTDGSTGKKTIDWSIAKAAVTVTAYDEDKLVGSGDDPDFEAQVDGLFGGDEIVYEVARTNKSEAVGKYDIVATGAAVQGNYDITYVKGTFKIRAGKITVNGKGYDDISAAIKIFKQDGGTAVCNEEIKDAGYTYSMGAVLEYDRDECFLTVTGDMTVPEVKSEETIVVKRTLTLDGDLYADIVRAANVDAKKVVLGANVTVGKTDEDKAESAAVLKFDEIDVNGHKLTLTAKGIVQSAKALDISATFTEVPEPFQITKKTLMLGGYEYKVVIPEP